MKTTSLKIVFQIALITLLFTNISFSQSNNWQRIYSGPSTISDFKTESVCKSDGDNTILFITDNFNHRECIYKLNTFGDIIQTKYYTDRIGKASVSSGDGGVVFSSDANNPYSAKIDFNCEEIWFKTYNFGGSGSICNDIIRTCDGFFVLAGGGYGIKIKTNGDFIWRKGYPMGVSHEFTSVIECPDGNYVFGGYGREFLGAPLIGVVTKVDTSGTVIWEKKYSLNSLYNFNNVRITKTANNFYLSGWEYEPVYDKCYISILKLDFSGNIIDTFKYNFYNTDNYITDTKGFNSNKIIVTYVRQSFYGDTALSSAFIIDTLGNVLVNREYGGTDFTWISKIYPIPPNTIYLVGNSKHISLHEHAYLIKTDTTLFAPPVSIQNSTQTVPESFYLEQNYPNPFNNSTQITFGIIKKGIYKLMVYDVTGKLVDELFNQSLEPGEYKTDFKAEKLSSGIYFYRLESDKALITKKFVLLK